MIDNKIVFNEKRRGEISISKQLYSELTTPSSVDFCSFVCDGMGGHAYGAVASLTAVQLLKKHYNKLLQAAAVSTAAIQNVISTVNDEFCQFAAGSRDLHAMGTTLCGVIVKDYHIYGINIGDSRFYMYQEGSLKQISVDHTEGQRLQSLGFLTAEEVQHFPNKKAIYKYIGQRVNLRPDVFEMDTVIPGTTLLLTTDGLTDTLTDEEICSILQAEKPNLKMCGSKLIEKAITRNIGFGDNITMIFIEF